MNQGFYIAVIILSMLMLYSTISLITGWHGLAKKFPLKEEETGEELSEYKKNDMKIGAFGRYKSAVTVTIYEHGVKLVPMPLLRLFHPPVFIKWKEMHRVQLSEHPYLRKKFEFFADTIQIRLYSKTAIHLARVYKNKKEDIFG